MGIFLNNIKKAFQPGMHLWVDECLYCFKRRCGFRQYMPNKPGKYEIKFS
jgi:hypothetical protein